MASGGTDGTIRLWDTEPLPYETPLHVDGGAVNWIAFSPDGSRLLSASDDLRLWDVEGRRLGPPFQKQGRDIWVAAFSPSGQLIASVDDRGPSNYGPYRASPWGSPLSGMRDMSGL